jgi:hypothetical protein
MDASIEAFKGAEASQKTALRRDSECPESPSSRELEHKEKLLRCGLPIY